MPRSLRCDGERGAVRDDGLVCEEVEPVAGSDQWIAFDATLPTDFVDATHLKFAQGDPTAMFQAIRVVGQLKAEVLDYHARPKE